MSEGFANPIVGGGGALVYPSVHSPDFVSGSAGWSIDKDGAAEFNNVTVRGVIDSGQFIGTGEGDEILIYSGIPAAGNLIASVTSASAVDNSGNHVIQGVTEYNSPGTGQYFAISLNEGQLSFWVSGPAEGPWALSGRIFGETFGTLAAQPADGNSYPLGHVLAQDAGIPVTSTVAAPVIGIPLGASTVIGSYHVTGWAVYHGDQAAGAPQFSWGGNGSGLALSTQKGYNGFAQSGGYHINNGALGAANGPVFTGTGETGPYVFDIYVTVTTAGQLWVYAAETVNGDSWEIDAILMRAELVNATY